MRFVAPAYEKIWIVLQAIEEYLTVHKTNHALIGTTLFEQKDINGWDAYQIIKNLEDEKVLVIKGEKPGNGFVDFPADDYTEHIPELLQLEINDKRFKKYIDNFQKRHRPIDKIKMEIIESAKNDPASKPLTKEVLKGGELTLDIGKATLQYGKKNPIGISPDNNGIKLLILLLRQHSVEYLEIMRTTHPGSYQHETINKKVARPVQLIRRDLGKILRSAGMKQAEVTSLITAIKNTGYRFHLNNTSQKTRKKRT